MKSYKTTLYHHLSVIIFLYRHTSKWFDWVENHLIIPMSYAIKLYYNNEQFIWGGFTDFWLFLWGNLQCFCAFYEENYSNHEHRILLLVSYHWRHIYNSSLSELYSCKTYKNGRGFCLNECRDESHDTALAKSVEKHNTQCLKRK